MDTRRLGTDGPPLSVVGLGCNNFGMLLDADATAAVVHAALDAGITHFDSAEMYGGGKSEEFLGAALAGRRDEAVIATKYVPRVGDDGYTPGALAARIRDACDGSLRRLGTDHIDLYYQHYPDPDAPIDEALEALAGLVESGKVRHIACSNSTAEQVDESQRVSTDRGWPRFAGNQVEWSLVARKAERSLVPAAARNGMWIIPYFPLASGLLTGKYTRGEAFPEGTRYARSDRFAGMATDENFDKVDAYTAFAEARGHTITELAIAWLLAQPTVASVIAGATSPAQVAANAAGGAWALTADEAAEVASI